MFTFLKMSDATGEALSEKRFDTIAEAAKAAGDYMAICAENGDYILTQIIDVSKHFAS